MAIRRKTPAKRVTTRRRRRVSSMGRITKAGMMTAAKDGVKAVAGGAAFGFVSNISFINDLDPMLNKGAKAAIILLTQSVLKQKEIALGMAGVFGAQLAEDLGLADSGLSINAGGNYLPPRSIQGVLNDGYEYDTLNDGIYPAYQANY